MTRDDVQSDLAYLRTLAESGERAPLTGGRFGIWWGGLATLVLLAHWAVITARLPLGLEYLWILWLGFLVIGTIGSVLLGLGMRGKPGTGSAGNRTSAAVWPAMGAGVFVYWIGVTAGVSMGQLEPVFFNTLLPVTLLGYGIAWLTTAQMARAPGLILPGAAALLGMAACVVYVMTAQVYLVAAVAVFLSAVLPGLVMERAAPKDTV